MPNHCENDLHISGSEEAVNALLAAIGADLPEPKFDFNAIISYPKCFQDLDDESRAAAKEDPYRYVKDGYNQGGYDWCSENWGTKWNAYEAKRRDYNGTILTFQTAWCFPRPVIIALAKAHPLCTLRLEYFEGGGAFAGGFTCYGEGDWYEDDPFEPGRVTNEWSTNDYRGPRGG